MPLRKGSSDAIRAQNIAEMVRSFQKTGSIGKTKPKSQAHARRIALAAAYSQQRKAKQKG